MQRKNSCFAWCNPTKAGWNNLKHSRIYHLQVPTGKRINRATCSIFRFKDGTIGNLSHSLVLHEDTYHTAFEILADGLQIIVEDPYGTGSVTVRRPHSREYEKVMLDDVSKCSMTPIVSVLNPIGACVVALNKKINPNAADSPLPHYQPECLVQILLKGDHSFTAHCLEKIKDVIHRKQ